MMQWNSLRHKLVRGLLWAVALGLLARVLWVNQKSFREVLDHKPDIRYLALALGLFVTGLVATFVRWWVVVRTQGLPLRLRDAIRVGFIGNALDVIVPGQVGGDVVKATFLCRAQERKTRAIAASLVDRAIGILGLFLLASLMGALQWPSSGPAIRRLIVIVWATLGAGLMAFSVVLTPALLRLIERLGARRGRRVRSILAELHATSVAYSDHKAGLALGLGMSTVSHTLLSLTFVMVSFALLPHPPRVLEQLLVVPLITFSTAVPLPFGALGLGEQVSDELFRMLGHSMGVVVMLGFRAIGLAASGISVMVYLANAQTVLHPSPTPVGVASQDVPISSSEEDASGLAVALFPTAVDTMDGDKL